MTPQDSVRYLHHASLLCRGRDCHEALCLLLPAILKALDLQPMTDWEALAFRQELKESFNNNNQKKEPGSNPAQTLHERSNSRLPHHADRK